MPRSANRASLEQVSEAGSPPRPFIKWAGGKAQLLPQLRALLPSSFRKYHEAFLGGVALFFALNPGLARRSARLTDLNAELVDCYRSVRDDVSSVVAALGMHKYDKDHFYAVRDQDPAFLLPSERAARMIFLNKTAFNGLYRVNGSGRFNVPFGRHRNPVICDEGNLRSCSAALAGVDVEVADFSSVTHYVHQGDFVYLDPPYVPLSETANFTAYSPGGFCWEDQRRLAEVFRALSKMQVSVMLSNSDTPQVRELYADFRIEAVLASRRINSQVTARGRITEIVIMNY